MSARAIKVHGRKVWQARVAYRGQRMSTIRPTKGEARTAEAELLGKLQAKIGELERAGGAPATVRALLKGYAEGLVARGKSADTVGRAASTALAVERLIPTLLDKPVGAVTDADVFAFRQARGPRKHKAPRASSQVGGTICGDDNAGGTESALP